jgi:hypothetical protein
LQELDPLLSSRTLVLVDIYQCNLAGGYYQVHHAKLIMARSMTGRRLIAPAKASQNFPATPPPRGVNASNTQPACLLAVLGVNIDETILKTPYQKGRQSSSPGYLWTKSWTRRQSTIGC